MQNLKEVAEGLERAESRAEREEIGRRAKEELAELLEWLRVNRPDEWHRQRAKEEGAAGDKRPLDHVMKLGEKEVPKKLSNTYRDWDHIGRFIANRERIDFLQVDGPQLRRLTDPNRTAPSQLHEYGVEDRVFAAGTLESVSDEIARLTAR